MRCWHDRHATLTGFGAMTFTGGEMGPMNVRRLRRVCRLRGADPQFVCTSATVANPEEFGRRLVGRYESDEALAEGLGRARWESVEFELVERRPGA